MFLFKKLPLINKTKSQYSNHQLYHTNTFRKKRNGFVGNLRSLTRTDKEEASKIDESDFLMRLSNIYNSQESVPAGVISFDEHLNSTVSDLFTIKMPRDFDDYLDEKSSDKVQLFFKSLSLRDKVLTVLILIGYDVYDRNNQCLGKNNELKTLLTENVKIDNILKFGGLSLSCTPVVFQSGLYKEHQLLQSQFFISIDSFNEIM